jgi:maltoporin
MKMRPTLLAAAALTLLSTTASAVDWGGYTRIGPGQKQNTGDGERCFDGGAGGGGGSQAPGHGGIGRLGNECNTYGEFALSQGMKAGGVDYKALLMTNWFSQGSTPAQATDTSAGNAGDNTPRVAQLYVEGKGFDVFPAASFWIGRRFYHRADVHFDDSFYVMGGLQGSTGAGIDQIAVGGGSLGVALFRTPDNNTAGVAPNAGSLLNVDLQDLAVNPGGKLRLTASFTHFAGTGGKSGTGLSLQHNQSGVFGADNTLWAQWSQGSAGLDMGFGGAKDDSNHKGWRIADSLAWLNGPLTGQTLIHYGHVQQPNGLGGTTATKTFSIAGRAAYALTKNFKIQGELGTANTKPDGAKSQNVTKFTIAPTLAVGQNYYDRPELRFYVSTFSMNDAYAAANGQTKKTKSAAGFQAEIWF